MGEKRKARMTNNGRTSKKEKKTTNTVVSSASNDDIEEQSSMHSNSSNSDNNSQPASITQENNNLEEIEESQTMTPINIENTTNKDHIELNSSSNIDKHKIINESTSTTKSWWSSLIRLFHFNNHTNENKSQIDNTIDHQPSSYNNENYLGNIKCRRSLHADSLVG